MNTAKVSFEVGVSMLLVVFCSLGFAQPTQKQIQGIISDRVGSQVSSGQAASAFGRLVKLDLAVGQTKGQIARIVYQPASSVYLQNFSDGALLVWDFAQGAQVDEFRLSASAVPVYYDTTTARLFIVDGARLVRLGRPKGGAPVSQPVLPDNVSVAAAAGDGRHVFVGGAGGEVIKVNVAGEVVWRGKALDTAVRQIAPSHDGSRVTALGDGGAARVLDDKGQPVSALQNVARLGRYDRGGGQTHLLQNREVVTISAQGATANRPVQLDGEIEHFSVNDAGDRWLAVTSGGRLSIGSAGRWELIDNGVKFGAFLGDRRFLSIKNDGVTHLRSQGLAHYLVALVPGSAGWVIVDHEGRYDGTVDGTKDVKWNAEGGSLSLDQFFEAYYQPGLLSAYVKEEEAGALGALPGKVRDGVYLPPKIQLDFPGGSMKPGAEYRVVAVAESTGGDLPDEIRVFHNGKRLPSKARIGTQKMQKGDQLLLVQVFAFVPESGVNEVFAEVQNIHGISARSEVKREITGGARAPGKLHILGIGIDKYRIPSMDLEFAATDIKAFVSRIAAGAKGRYDQVVPNLLMDAGATNQGLRSLLEKLSEVGPQDSLIIALAGHGEFHNGEWYFLPHDVNPRDIAGTGISARELQDALVNSPAKRIFLMVDACNSGAGIDSFNRYRAFQRRFAQQVGRGAGVSVLTATRRDQLAAEVPQLGHGLFTHTVLDGLRGAADRSPSDGRISAHELANFVGENLESRARPFLESHRLTQSPAHFVIGSDFLISDVTR